MQNFYEVTFTNNEGKEISSRIFQTIRAARNWARYLVKADYIVSAKIYKGGVGGQVVL